MHRLLHWPVVLLAEIDMVVVRMIRGRYLFSLHDEI